MAARKIPVASTDKSQYVNFWSKAVDFRDAMRQSMASGKWNAAALNSIHAAISANDALLVFLHGVRSVSPKHDDAAKLLKSLVRHTEASTNASRLRRLLTAKNIIEYEGTICTAAKARDLAKHVERFMDWIESLLP